MSKDIYQLFLSKTEEETLVPLILQAIRQFGYKETFKSLRLFYLQEDVDLYEELKNFDLKKEDSRRDFFILRDIVKDLVPYTKIKDIHSLLICLNFYLFNCPPGEITLSFVLDKLPELHNKNPEALDASLDVLTNDGHTVFHCLLTQSILSSLCRKDPNVGKERVFFFLEKNEEHELIGAIGALDSLSDFDDEIVPKIRQLLERGASDWVVTNVVLILLRICKRNLALVSDVRVMCENLLYKNRQLVIALIERSGEFLELGESFESLLLKAMRHIEESDEMALCCLDLTLSKCLKNEKKISFVLEALSELSVKKRGLLHHLQMTTNEIKNNPSFLAKTLIYFLAKPNLQFWQSSTHFVVGKKDDLGLDLLFLQSELNKELEEVKLSISELVDRVVCGMFLVPRSALSLFLIFFRWLQPLEDARKILENLYSPFAINYAYFCIDFFENIQIELNQDKKKMVTDFLSRLKDINTQIEKAHVELPMLRLSEKESLIVNEFENMKQMEIFQQGMSQSIINMLGVHRGTLLYGRGVLYYQRSSSDKMTNRKVSHLASFSTSVTWPLMSLTCPSVLEHILAVKALKVKK